MRFDAEQEQQVGRSIRMAEMCTRDALFGLDEAEIILRARPKREERTRAGAVDRLEQAVMMVRNMAKRTDDPEIKAIAVQASRHWDEAEALRDGARDVRHANRSR